jgi:hypothetical protein
MMPLIWAVQFGGESPYWHLLPLVIVISIVYSGTRHEQWPLIWRRALRLTVFIVTFLAVTLGMLWGLQTL